MFKTSILLLMINSFLSDPVIYDYRPTEDLLSQVTTTEGITTDRLDLTAEALTPIFKGLYDAALLKQQTVEKTVIHKLPGDEKINNTLHVTYRVIYSSNDSI